jgi:glyoxylase-like metal-dependent hydrolase (beta-lactamase superfamily II)
MERRTVGNVEVIALVDNIQRYPATAVYTEAGEGLKRYAGMLDAEGQLELNFASFLLVDGDRKVLVDTGWGPEFEGRLLAEMAAAGVKPGEVDTVIFTHLHGDHTGWNFDRASGRPLFPAARYLVPKGDWDHYAAEQPPPDSFTRDVAPLKGLGLLDLIEGETTLTPSLTAVPTPGHTPGHTSVAITSGGQRGFILGDVVISTIDAAEPSWANSFESDTTIARATRQAVIARLASDGSLVGASHLPVPGFGRFVSKAGTTGWERA